MASRKLGMKSAHAVEVILTFDSHFSDLNDHDSVANFRSFYLQDAATEFLVKFDKQFPRVRAIIS